MGANLGPFWEPRSLEIRKMPRKNSGDATQERLRTRFCFLAPLGALLASIFGGSGLDFWRFLEDVSNILAYFLDLLDLLLCWGGYASPDPPALDLVFVFHGQVFSQFAKKTQELTERESRNLPRTKPRTKSLQSTTGNDTCQKLVLLSFLPNRKTPWAKNIGRRYSPQGGFN